MWISRQAKTAPPGDKAPAEVGRTTLAGDPAAVYVSGERRQVPLFSPGGYFWRPAAGEELLVIKTGEEGELPCAVGRKAGATPTALQSGEVAVASKGAHMVLRNGGGVEISGEVDVQGSFSVNGETVESMILRILASMMG